MSAITVYCSASNNINKEFFSRTAEIISLLVKNNFNIIYGGGSHGLMGEVANTTIKHNGHLTGIIPELLINTEKPFDQANELIFVSSMNERKKLLAEKANGFLILPGGLGTLDELFEILTLKAVDYFNKPIAIYNINNFFTPIVSYIEQIANMGFLKHGSHYFETFTQPEDILYFFKKEL